MNSWLAMLPATERSDTFPCGCPRTADNIRKDGRGSACCKACHRERNRYRMREKRAEQAERRTM